MPLSTLVDVLLEFRKLGDREALVFDNGSRIWRFTYRELNHHISNTALVFQRRGLKKGDRLILWSENRPEWIFSFWACVLGGIEVVPVDFRFSPGLLSRIETEVQAKLVVTGESVDPGSLRVPVQSARGLAECAEGGTLKAVPIDPEDVAQIVFTSGTTGQPRGIVHRHRNLCANLDPFRTEIEKWKRLMYPFQPVRVMSLLPLSHLFGQSVSLFIPPLLGGAVVLTTEVSPSSVIATIKRTRTSALAVVPRMLLNFQKNLQRRFALSGVEMIGRGWTGTARRWWRFRRLHSVFGFKFGCLIVGGAAIGPESESFWRKLGFLVVQGYGLTESSPVISVNYPFDTKAGSVGKVIEGQNLRLSRDGEILVRGRSVADEFVAGGESPRSLLEDGWLHTGDIGELDSEGRLFIKGRKKDVIVTSSGLNVFPEDVEPVLENTPGIREAVVIGLSQDDEETVHAVLILEKATIDPSKLIESANRLLEDHQRIHGWTVWPSDRFPRTPSTQKIKRSEVLCEIERLRSGNEGEHSADGIELVLANVASGARGSSRRARLSEDLGLSSLDRVELLGRVEDHFGIRLDEDRFSELRTVEDLENLVLNVQSSDPGSGEASPAVSMPRWATHWPARLLRRCFYTFGLSPLFRNYVHLTVSGLDCLKMVRPPVLFAANHSSHLDTPAILVALPGQWRNSVTPAMLADYFAGHFGVERVSFREKASNRFQYILACMLFGAYPLPQRISGVREALRYTGDLVSRGFCPLVFPEGMRSPDGEMRVFRPGIGLMAQRLGVPVVPVRIDGTHTILSVQDSWPRRGSVSVQFGPPIVSPENDAADITREIEAAIRDMGG